MERVPAGFEEVEHSADWALRVWAPDLPALFEQAALGMQALAGIELKPQPLLSRKLELEAPDPESLLVAFLGELLHYADSEGIGFRQYSLAIDGGHLKARLEGAPIYKVDKEIKAVTFHNLAIQPAAGGLQVQLVFDV